MRPKRIQRKRTKGWRKPGGAVIVDRTSRWGNPFRVGDPDVPDRAAAVRKFEEWLIPYRSNKTGTIEQYLISEANMAEVQEALRGRDLVCFCPLDEPCHADVLLRIANDAPMVQR